MEDFNLFQSKLQVELERLRARVAELEHSQVTVPSTEILENISEGFYAVDHQWRLTYINKKAEELWQRKREELLDKVLWTIFEPGYESSTAYKMHQKAAQEHIPVSFETFYSNLNRWVLTRIYPNPNGLLVYFQDISDTTEHRKAEAALRTNEERLRLITDNVPVQIGYYDRELRYRFVNAEYSRFFGVPKEQIEGRSIREFVGEVTWARLEPWMLRALAGERVTFEDIAPDKHGPGKHSWTEETYIPQFAPDGTVEGLIALVLDITERKRIEEALRKSEEDLRVITDNVPALIAYHDREIRYRFINAAFPRFFGRPGEAIVGRTVPEVVGERVFARLEPWMKRALAGETVSFEDMEPDKYGPGQHSWTEENYIPRFAADGSVEGFFVLAIDITERKRAEANQQLLVEIAEILMRVSTEAEIMQSIGARLAEHLRLDSYNFVEVDEERGELIVKYNWNSQNVPSYLRAFPMAEYTRPEYTRALRDGETVVINDTQNDSRLDAEGHAEINAFALVAIPYHRNGQWVGFFSVTDRVAREWLKDEIELVHEVTNRTFLRLERARSEAALRQSEEKYRSLFESIDEGFGILEMIFDENGKAVDYRLLEANPAFEGQSGISRSMVGRRRSEFPIEPTQQELIEVYGRVVVTGIPERFETYSKPYKRFYDVYVFRLGEASEGKVTVLFNDISERKRAEANQAYLLKLSDALRPLTDPLEIQATASLMLGEYLGTDRAYYVQIDEVNQKFVVARDWHQPGAPSHARDYPLDDWPMPWLIDGKTWVVRDVDVDLAMPDDQRESYRGNDIGAAVVVPLIKANRLVATFVTNQRKPRSWTSHEVTLVEETAERTWAAVERARAETALRESEQNLRGVANIVPDLLWYSVPDGSTYWYNQRWMEYTGQTLEQATGWGWAEVIHPDEREASVRRYRQATAQGKSLQQEYRIHRQDGQYRWFLVRVEPLCDQEGQVTRMYGAATDIHEQRLALEALRQSEERLQKAVSIQTVGILFFNVEGIIYGANAAFQRMSGYSLEAFQSGTVRWEVLTPPEFIEVTLKSQQELLTKGENTPYEKQYIRPDGSRWWGLFAGKRLSEHEYVEFVLDITETRRAEEALRTAEEQYRLRLEHEVIERTGQLKASRDLLQATMDSSMDMIQVFEAVRDERGEIVDFKWILNNHTSEKNYGDVIGKSLLQNNPGVVQENIFETFKRVVETGLPDQSEHHYVHEQFDGWFFQSVVKLGDGVASTTTDITVLKRAEQMVVERTAELEEANILLQEERSRLKVLSSRLLEVQESERRHLARELHDEVGQYLTGLKFLLQSIDHSPSEPQATQLARTIATLDELTARVRELSLNLRPTLLDDMGLVPALVSYFQRYTAQTNIEVGFFQNGLDGRLPTEIETVVYRVVQEALTNIARHAEVNRILVQILLEDQITLLIQDEGKGFNLKAVLSSHASSGLSAMRERVELVGGEFTIETEPGYGTSIIAEIPLNHSGQGRAQEKE